MSMSASVRRPAHYSTTSLHSPASLSGTKLLQVQQTTADAPVRITAKASAPPYISGELLAEMATVDSDIRAGVFGHPKYRILASARPGVFSLGGDLKLFLNCIHLQDGAGLMAYGRAAIDGVWSNLSGCGIAGLNTIAVVQGEAQGGGFEAALSCHSIVAEEGSVFGFPESLFGLFPGMGAELLLSARTDPGVAQRLVSRAHRYPAELLHEMGIVDYLLPRGQGLNFAEDLALLPPTPGMRNRRHAFGRIAYGTLLATVERWVFTAMTLPPRAQRVMQYLLEAQRISERGAELYSPRPKAAKAS